MGRTETEFMAEALALGYPLRQKVTVPWLTWNGHRNPNLDRFSETVINVLHELFIALGGDEARLIAKAGQRLQPDSFLREQILELDEIQHFSTARLNTFEFYPADAQLGFDIDEYRDLCRRWAPSGGDRYRAAKATVDFPRPGGRTAQRAYFDAVRDLLAPHTPAGPVIRIPAPECDPTTAVRRLRSRLAPSTASQYDHMHRRR